MFGIIKEMFSGLLSACTIATFAKSLAFNYKKHIKFVWS